MPRVAKKGPVLTPDHVALSLDALSKACLIDLVYDLLAQAPGSSEQERDADPYGVLAPFLYAVVAYRGDRVRRNDKTKHMRAALAAHADALHREEHSGDAARELEERQKEMTEAEPDPAHVAEVEDQIRRALRSQDDAALAAMEDSDLAVAMRIAGEEGRR